MYDLNINDPYGDYIRHQKARQAEAQQKMQQNNQLAQLGGELGGLYLAKKATGGGLLSALFGSGEAATPLAFNSGVSSGIIGVPGIETVVPSISGAAPTTAAATPFMGIGALPVAGIAAATALGGKSLYDLIRGKKDNSLAGKAGRVTLGIATGGLSEVARHFLGDQDKWKTESRRLGKLKDKGINIPQSLIDSMPKKGRSTEELINPNFASDFIGFSPAKDWINNKFATSRNEADLRPEDVVNYAAFSEKFGNDFANADLSKRLEVAKMALDAKALNEHHSTIDFNDALNATLTDKIKNYLGASLPQTEQAKSPAGLGLAALVANQGLKKPDDVKIVIK